MVGAVQQQHVVDAHPRKLVLVPLDEPLSTLGEVLARAQLRRAVVVAEQVERRDLTAVRRAPAKHTPDTLELVAQPAREEKAVDPEAAEHLRQLRRMTEAVGQVARARGLRTEAPADGAAEEQIANERLAAHEELVREDVARADDEPAGRQQRAQSRFLLRPQLEVVLQHDRLAVERERAEAVVPFECCEHLVDERRELEAEVLERQVPLPIPVRVRDDKKPERRRGQRRMRRPASASTSPRMPTSSSNSFGPAISGSEICSTGSPRSSARQIRPRSNIVGERKPRSIDSDSSSSNVSRVSLSFTNSRAQK